VMHPLTGFRLDGRQTRSNSVPSGLPVGVPENLIKLWLGHSQNLMDLYATQLRYDVAYRRERTNSLLAMRTVMSTSSAWKSRSARTEHCQLGHAVVVDGVAPQAYSNQQNIVQKRGWRTSERV